MDDTALDQALIAAGFAQIAARGWHRFNVAEAAREAGLPLERARRRIGCRAQFLTRFGRLADTAALTGADTEGPTRDRLFDMLMRRIDALQTHRDGVIALLKAVPLDPPAALLLANASLTSMGWLLAAAGLEAGGPIGQLRRKGLLAVWLWTVRAWQTDTSEDLAATMAALDQALDKAEHVAGWLRGARKEDQGAPPPGPPPGAEPLDLMP